MDARSNDQLTLSNFIRVFNNEIQTLALQANRDGNFSFYKKWLRGLIAKINEHIRQLENPLYWTYYLSELISLFKLIKKNESEIDNSATMLDLIKNVISDLRCINAQNLAPLQKDKLLQKMLSDISAKKRSITAQDNDINKKEQKTYELRYLPKLQQVLNILSDLNSSIDEARKNLEEEKFNAQQTNRDLLDKLPNELSDLEREKKYLQDQSRSAKKLCFPPPMSSNPYLYQMAHDTHNFDAIRTCQSPPQPIYIADSEKREEACKKLKQVEARIAELKASHSNGFEAIESCKLRIADIDKQLDELKECRNGIITPYQQRLTTWLTYKPGLLAEIESNSFPWLYANLAKLYVIFENKHDILTLFLFLQHRPDGLCLFSNEVKELDIEMQKSILINLFGHINSPDTAFQCLLLLSMNQDNDPSLKDKIFSTVFGNDLSVTYQPAETKAVLEVLTPFLLDKEPPLSLSDKQVLKQKICLALDNARTSPVTPHEKLLTFWQIINPAYAEQLISKAPSLPSLPAKRSYSFLLFTQASGDISPSTLHCSAEDLSAIYLRNMANS